MVLDLVTCNYLHLFSTCWILKRKFSSAHAQNAYPAQVTINSYQTISFSRLCLIMLKMPPGIFQ